MRGGGRTNDNRRNVNCPGSVATVQPWRNNDPVKVMPFDEGSGRVHLPSAELRVISAHDDGLHIEIRPSDGPIGGIAIFLGSASFPALLRGIADSMHNSDGNAAAAAAPGAAQTSNDPPAAPGMGDEEVSAAETAAAEIWLRAGPPRQATERTDDVLDPPSFWQRFRDRRHNE